MAAADDVDELIEQYHLALDQFMKGNPEPVQRLFPIEKTHPSPTLKTLPCAGGSRSLRLWSAPHRLAEAAGSLASRP